MGTLVWDADGTRGFETGIDQGVLYVVGETGYGEGVAWNGLTAVTETPSGAEAKPQYADNRKYLNLVSAEELGASIEAFFYPDEFEVCDGTVEAAPGVAVHQQTRATFGLCYRTKIGNDQDGQDAGYKLHLLYGALAAPSQKAYKTVNDSPEATAFSWTLTTTGVAVTGLKPTSLLTIDSTTVPEAKMTALEDILYGKLAVKARLPLPNEIITLITAE